MRCYSCNTPISLFRSAFINKSIDCKSCGAEMTRIKRSSQFDIVGIVIGLIAVKLLSLKFDYWIAFILVLLIFIIIDEKATKYEITKKPAEFNDNA